jgi:thiamine-triphosphatase
LSTQTQFRIPKKERKKKKKKKKKMRPMNPHPMISALSSLRMALHMSPYPAAGGAGGASSLASIPSHLSAMTQLSPLSARLRKTRRRPFALDSQANRPTPQRPAAVLEVERKFAPTAASIRRLDQNSGEPPFNSVVHKGVTCFQDTYYDTPEHSLSNAGVYLRRRDKFGCTSHRFAPDEPADPSALHVSWEAKVRVGGDLINSAFREITDVQDISAMLSTLVPGTCVDAQHGPQGGQMRELAKLVTNRTSYFVNGKFTVVIDVTDFGHTIGEVELEGDASEAEAEGQGEGEGRALRIAAMDNEIGHFMRRFIWAFPSGSPVGKLTAYFEHKTNKRRGGQW